MKRLISISAAVVLFGTTIFAQQNYSITSTSVGNVRLGMTIATAWRTMRGFTFRRTSDGDGVALVEVRRGGKSIMTLYADERNPKARINEHARIEHVRVFDRSYRTANGIRTEMLVGNAETKLGGIEEVFMSEIESREYVVFRKKTKGLMYRIDVPMSGNFPTAGVYPEGKRITNRYAATAFISAIEVSKYFD
ncbi:MAG: hypothetical protein ACR2IH_04615 [Pyrinomonadaceae bacterium]